MSAQTKHALPWLLTRVIRPIGKEAPLLDDEAELERIYHGCLIWVFIFALGLRVGITAFYEGLDAPPKYSANPDQVDYELFAHKMASGEGYALFDGEPTARRAPGTSFTLLPIYWMFGRSFLVARLWICFISAITCIALAWAIRPFLDRRIALVSAIALSVYPGHFYYSMHFLSEVPFCFFLVGALGFTLRSIKRPGICTDLCAGYFWGMAALTRLKIVLAAPVGLAMILLWSRRRPTRIASLTWQVMVFVVVMAPWLVRNAVVMHTPSLCTVVGGYTFWGAHNDVVLNDTRYSGSWVNTTDLIDAAHPLSGDEIQQEAAAWKYGKAWVAEHWRDMPWLCTMKIIKLLSPFEDTPNMTVFYAFALGWILYAPLALLGLPILYWRDKNVFCVIAAPLLTTLLTAVIFYGSSRFRDAIAPVFAVLAALAVVYIRDTVHLYIINRSSCGAEQYCDDLNTAGCTS